MKFEEYPFIIPDLKEIETKYTALLTEFEAASTAKAQVKVIKKIMKLEDNINTVMTNISVCYSVDTTNEKYVEAQDACDEMGPQIAVYQDKYSRLLVNSPFRADLEKTFGSLLFKMAEQSLKCFDEKIVEDLQTENRLTSKYTKIYASAKIKFQGGVYNLSQMGKFMINLDRNVRKSAAKAVQKFNLKHEKEISEIFDELVHVRDTMAKKLGYKNYIEFGYNRLGRTDYNAEMVATYRKQIEECFVPIWKKLYKKQAKRIQIRSPRFYDMSLEFLSGNPTPAGDSQYLVNEAKKMYDTMSNETGIFFNFMIDNHLLELEAKPGKSGGGFMTYFPDYKAPFIFANFNGTSDDVDVLTHEVGHAFQGYCSRDIEVPEYRSPTLEACEIHSMSMEFFAWPYAEGFFGKDAEKYRFVHLASAINFIPYGASVDEFQHYVYENVNATHEQRCAKWREIEKKYTPYKNYKGFDYLERGNRWMGQSHIFQTPFYYIDYTLAQVVAFQFLVETQADYDKAWKKYVKLCKLGGSLPFLSLLDKAKLRNPFVDGSLKKIIRPLKKILNSFDDTKM